MCKIKENIKNKSMKEYKRHYQQYYNNITTKNICTFIQVDIKDFYLLTKEIYIKICLSDYQIYLNNT